METIKKEVISKLILVLISLIIVFLIITFGVRTYNVTSGSMETTIMTHDRLIANVFKAQFLSGKRGDSVVFIPPYKGTSSDLTKDPYVDDSLFFINSKKSDRFLKRIIGIPGDTIDIKDNKVYVNGKVIKEDYLAPGVQTNVSDSEKVSYPLKLDKNEYFVMGDNRENSWDSRAWGVLPGENIVSYPILVFYPFNDFRILNK